MATDQNSNFAAGSALHPDATELKQRLVPPSSDSSEKNPSRAVHNCERDTSSKKTKNNNAMSQGLYSKDVTLPLESQDDFEKLHKDFVEEWTPNSHSEKEAILKLARITWLKRQIIRKRKRELEPDIKKSRSRLPRVVRPDAKSRNISRCSQKFAISMAVQRPF
jgi:hypothetical protein